ncbi:MAG: exodeoxyribonuclease beta subunit, partial [Frankiales bacterium]|nr:exodeoxyribonuclease beta subunit [Frankiales bacterium]
MTTAVDLRGPLPTGTVVLEASAGTGKTYTIAGLVTRYVAQGHAPLEQLLVVTFGRAATSELRTRVRERLLAARDALVDPATALTSADPVIALLAEVDVEVRRRRLEQALAGFDAATVATTHEFCQQVLRSLGTAADLDPGTVLVEDLRDLVTEVADDLYLRFYARTGAPTPAFDRPTAQTLAQQAVQYPEHLLLPDDAAPDSPAQVRVRFAAAVREEVDRRKRALRVVGFDDLLIRVRDALVDPVSGPVACARLRERYAVVLVDEFQDTDPVQWEVLRTAFHGHRDLVVIGDPKQAIYAFRGADVRAYLSAKQAATSDQTLDTNWRSDTGVLEGTATLLRGAALGHPDIVVRPVRAGHTERALSPGTAPVRLRALQRAGLPQTQRGTVEVGGARTAVAVDVAQEVVRMLRSGRTVTPREGAPRPVDARDVAILVRTGVQARLVRDELLDVGVPVVLTTTASVFATEAAADWRVLLEALEQPHRSGRVRRLALTSLVGETALTLDAGGVALTDVLALRLREWAEVLQDRGVAALFAAVSEAQGLVPRLLSQPDGERTLTDLRHVTETLHAAALQAQLGLSGLLGWLRSRSEEAGGDQDQERSRRLDTDEAAVQVVTVHASKGLEFPVVLVPYGWDPPGGGTRERWPRGHASDGRRTLFVGGPEHPEHKAACRELDAEDAGEELRLLYVAVTRAVSELVLWWSPSTKTEGGPLHRLLFCDDPSQVPQTVKVPDDAKALAHLRSLGLVVEPVHERERLTWSGEAPPSGDLVLAQFTRGLDLSWRRTSYSGLTRAAHDAPHVGSEPEVSAKDDEADTETVVADDDGLYRDVPSPMADLAGGTTFGTLVHAVLEEADLTSLEGLTAVAEVQLRRRSGPCSAAELAEALLPSVSASLGPLADGLALRDIARTDLLAELDFELPLSGGDVPGPVVTLGQVAELLRRHLPSEDPVAPYADMLDVPGLSGQVLRGYLG